MGKLRLILQIFLLLIFILSFTLPEIKNSQKNYFVLDTETIDWLDRVDSAGGTVSDSVVAAVDDYIKEIKGLKFQTINIRDLIVRENWFCGDFNSAFVPIFRNSDGSSSISGLYKDVNHNLSGNGV